MTEKTIKMPNSFGKEIEVTKKRMGDSLAGLHR